MKNYPFDSSVNLVLFFSCSPAVSLQGSMRANIQREKAEETTSSAFSGSGTAPASENWGLSFPKEGASPQANATPEELSASWAYYIGNPKKRSSTLLSTVDLKTAIHLPSSKR